MKTPALRIACVVVLSITALSTLAATTTITTNKDTTIYANNTNNSSGGGFAMFSGTDGTPSNKRALLSFNIAGSVPAGSTITSVQLTLFLAQAAGNVTTGNQTLSLHTLTDNWGEGTVGTGATINTIAQGLAAGNGI